MIVEMLTLATICLAALIYFTKDLIMAVVFLAALNLFVALIFYLMMAPDLAVTQASVNAALSTIIFVYAIMRCER